MSVINNGWKIELERGVLNSNYVIKHNIFIIIPIYWDFEFHKSVEISNLTRFMNIIIFQKKNIIFVNHEIL